MMETIECDIVVLGAGVIGLAAASRIADGRSVIVLESHSKFGQETSSRNSEVIHSGIYYPLLSKKTEWCIQGREALYEFCQKKEVPFARMGKIIVASNSSEEEYLVKLSDHCRKINVPHEWLAADAVHSEEPWIQVHCGILFPESGIVNSHVLMAVLEKSFLEKGGMLAYRHQVESIEKRAGGWSVSVKAPEQSLKINAEKVVNAAGLAAAEWSNQALGVTRYEHRFCRGRYFGLSSKYRGKFKHLIYPVPPKDGLGIHVTLDLDGYARLGPDVDWCRTHRYSEVAQYYDCDWSALQGPFVTAVHRYCPMVEPQDLTPGLIGIRPKLFLDGVAHPDFLIENFEGFVHCLGIESPGLTSSLVIADEVARLLN